MLNYETYPCPHCGELTLIYLQYVGDANCESCGKWEQDAPIAVDGPEAVTK